MLNRRTELHIFDRGCVIGDCYCEEVLLPHVRLFRGAIGPDFSFMDDNARLHRTLAVEELLESEDINRMDWPAYSPDLNPIEHMWDALGRRIASRLHHPENTQKLKQMLIEEWALLPQEMLHQLVLSMRRRCEVTIAVRGGHIPYEGTSACCSSCWIDHHESRRKRTISMPFPLTRGGHDKGNSFGVEIWCKSSTHLGCSTVNVIPPKGQTNRRK
ncbi:transposable element Tcb2 transposase [Trichonephila clavipes]|nr:transposable element Tcb2 transposase [Trichonephila clavipes]